MILNTCRYSKGIAFKSPLESQLQAARSPQPLQKEKGREAIDMTVKRKGSKKADKTQKGKRTKQKNKQEET